MRKSSIHFSNIKSSSEKHNTREYVPNYCIDDEYLKSQNVSFIETSVEDKHHEINNLYRERTGQNVQKRMQPIKESVVVLDEKHCLDDKGNIDRKKANTYIEKLKTHLKEKHSINTFQHHIHFDEGKDKGNINYHAHLIHDWQNKETGRTLKFNKKDMREIQTTTAQSLEMQRGELYSKSERLEHKEYRGEKQRINNELETMREMKKKNMEELNQLRTIESRNQARINQAEFKRELKQSQENRSNELSR